MFEEILGQLKSWSQNGWVQKLRMDTNGWVQKKTSDPGKNLMGVLWTYLGCPNGVWKCLEVRGRSRKDKSSYDRSSQDRLS